MKNPLLKKIPKKIPRSLKGSAKKHKITKHLNFYSVVFRVFFFIFLSHWALGLVYKSPVKLNEAAKVYQGQQVWVFKGGYAKQLAQACKPLDAVYHREINQFLSCQTPENMSKILILLFALFALTHAVFERTDCSCTCKDGKVCVKAVPNYLEGNTQECQCKDGTCPSGLEFNGK